LNKEQIEWYPWGAEVLERASREEKPIFLFVTHRGCYWCEQMEKESFSDTDILGLIQKYFIAVRVDSYERPDIGRYCHRLFTQMTGREANDPLNIFISPERIPLYTASYIPDRGRDGMMGMDETLSLIAKKYSEQRRVLLDKGGEVLAAMEHTSSMVQATKLTAEIISLISEQIKTLYDAEDGGFGETPKFPRYSVLQLLMDMYERTKEAELKSILKKTLDAMVEKGLRDHDDGGFHRYCIDRAWEKPYQGKMLYDNALMGEILLRASELFGEERYTEIAMETIKFIRSSLMLDGCFCALYDEGVVKNERIIISWNAMMIKTLFFAGERDRIYKHLAIESLSKLLEYSMRVGKLYHSFMIGEEPETEAFLEDYATLADTLMVAYEYTGEEHYLVKASELINEALRRFFNGGLWRYSDGEFTLPADTIDGDYPAALSVMASTLQKATTCIDKAYEKFSMRTLEVHSYALMRQPLSMPVLARAALVSIDHSG